MTQLAIPHELARAHVLIVDDDRGNRLVLRSICEKLGIGIIDEAEDGAVALELITRFRPDLVLLDIRMPNMDGFELMRHLRTHPEWQNMAILVQTGLQDTADRLRCFDLGASDVVSRPFDLNELTARIRAHLRSVIAARVLFDFRNRIQAHLEITRAFLDAVLPTDDQIQNLEQAFGLQLSHFYQPHDEIGGDLWTLRRLNEHQLALVVIDASAHGLAGAINALRVDCLVQEYFSELSDPGRFLQHLDRAMAKISFGQLFAGAFALVFDQRTGQIHYAGSGIPAPLIGRGGDFVELAVTGLPAGSGMLQTTTTTLTLAPQDTLVLFTDGWSELSTEPPAQMLRGKNLIGRDAAQKLIPTAPAHDDITLITMRRR